jgi:hypothetical protein
MDPEVKTRPRRSVVDWILELVALAAFVALIAIAANHWTQIPIRPRRFLPPPGVMPWTPHTVLGIMLALGSATYVLLTMAGQFQRLVSLPPDVDRDGPQVRQLLLSMMIVLKAVVMVLFVYLTWTLVQVTTGHSRGLSPGYLTLFVALVPLPLILYTVKLRRYRK